jgi:hypothetical protein
MSGFHCFRTLNTGSPEVNRIDRSVSLVRIGVNRFSAANGRPFDQRIRDRNRFVQFSVVKGSMTPMKDKRTKINVGVMLQGEKPSSFGLHDQSRLPLSPGAMALMDVTIVGSTND